MTVQEFKDKYGQSENGNFYFGDTISVPHPYCITPKHLEYNDSMYLDGRTIRRAEEKGAKCGIKNCTLSYEEHKQALVVVCKEHFADKDNMMVSELHHWLLSIKYDVEGDGYAGFAFVEESVFNQSNQEGS